MRYVPKKKLDFGHLGGDGPMCLLFDDGQTNHLAKLHTWKVCLLTALPAAYYASLSLPAEQSMLVYPMLFMPTFYYMLQASRSSRRVTDQISKMWLLKNGDQLICQTQDGVMHKLNILQNTHHDIKVGKNKELTFEMTNCGRDFRLSNSGAKHIDYDLIDRVIHQVPIDTKRFRGLYHNLQYKQ